MTDDDLRRLWREHGGSFHGPHIETGTMPEAKLLPFLRGLMIGLVGEAGGGYQRQAVTFAEAKEGTVFSFTGGRLRFDAPSSLKPEDPPMTPKKALAEYADRIGVADLSNMQILTEYIERTTHWVGGGPDRHSAKLALQIVQLQLGLAKEALARADALNKIALPQFNWGASALSGEAIRLLNEVPAEVERALRELS